MPRTVVLHTSEVGLRWYGVACIDERLVATAATSSRAQTLEHLRRSLPTGVAHRVAGDDRSDFVDRTIALLAELEAGHEEHKAFSLPTDLVGEPLVLQSA